VPTIAASSRPYVSRRKRHRKPSIMPKLSPKAIMAVMGLLLLVLVVSLGVIAFNLSREDSPAVEKYEVELAPAPASVAVQAPR
jgi:hypothetical protein